MDDFEPRRDIGREVQARQLAGEILGVGDDASPREIRRAWRKRCLEVHPDRNPGAPDAERKFRMVTCAYRLLTEGAGSHELLTQAVEPTSQPAHSRFDLTNAWGYHLWWRETFF